MQIELSFPLLDDVLPLLAEQEDMGPAEAVTTARIDAIGPLLEYAFQAKLQNNMLPPLGSLEPCQAVLGLRQLLEVEGFGQVPLSISHDSLTNEYTWLPPSASDSDAPQWMMFLRRLQNAARDAGFTTQVARGLVGAFVEMADNVLQHSHNPRSGVGAYRWERGCFEYAVADAGIGMLASLRTCPDYLNLNDAGTALQTALRDGESCRGRNPQNGLGFRQVLVSLAELNGSLRFRSGDHVLTIDGTSPDLSKARLRHVGLEYRGFLISAVCRPQRTKPEKKACRGLTKPYRCSYTSRVPREKGELHEDCPFPNRQERNSGGFSEGGSNTIPVGCDSQSYQCADSCGPRFQWRFRRNW